MITEINNSRDCRQALNENLYGLLTGKRKPQIVKEVNNTIGKYLMDVKMEMMNKAMISDRTGLRWFNDIDFSKQIESAADKKIKKAV